MRIRCCCLLTMLMVVSFVCVSSAEKVSEKYSPFSVDPLNKGTETLWTHLNFGDDSKDFRFAIVADFNGGRRPGVCEDAMRKLNLLQPDFVLCVGDLASGYTKDLESIKKMREGVKSLVSTLKMPFFYVVGNHDLSNDVMVKEWNERFGTPYYHFLYKNALFLCVDSEDPPASHISEAQIEYFKRALAEHKEVRWTFVFMHKPLWTDRSGNSNWEKFEPLLEGRPHTVFVGHTHNYLKYTRKGSDYIVLSTTGGGSNLLGPAYGGFDGITWVSMSEGEPQIANLMLGGILDKNIRNEEKIAAYKSLTSGGAISLSPIIVDSDTFTEGNTNLKIANDSPYPLQISASLSPQPNFYTEPAKVDITVPTSEAKDLSMTLKTFAPVALMEPPQIVNVAWKASFKVPGDSTWQIEGLHPIVLDRLFNCFRSMKPIAIDGKLDEWGSLPFVCKKPMEIGIDQRNWKGAGDSMFSFAVNYDDKNLYVALNVEDDVLFQDATRKPWEQDAIEIHLDARPDPERSAGIGANQFVDYLCFVMNPRSPSEPCALWEKDKLPSGCNVACVKTEKGYAAELSIPVEYLDSKQGGLWSAFRMNLAVDDYDNGPRSGAQLWWRTNWKGRRNFSGSGTFLRR